MITNKPTICSFSRSINDLDDVRGAMSALKEIREEQIKIDMNIGPAEESYALLNKLELFFNDGNAERVDGLAYGWKNLMGQVSWRLHWLFYRVMELQPMQFFSPTEVLLIICNLLGSSAIIRQHLLA